MPSNRCATRRGTGGAGGRTGRDGRWAGARPAGGAEAGAWSGSNAGMSSDRCEGPAPAVTKGRAGVPTGLKVEGGGARGPAWLGLWVGRMSVGRDEGVTTSSHSSQARTFGPEGRAAGSLDRRAVMRSVRGPARRGVRGGSLTTVAIEVPRSKGNSPSTA
jgi:hypothetical protein